MHMLDASVISFGPPSNIQLLNLPMFSGGTESLLRRIPPQTSGIYAFYRHMGISDAPLQAFSEINTLVESKKFADRASTIAPLYHVTISSKSKLSEGKRDRILKATEDPQFITTIKHALSLSILFQSPLYIGKAQDLRTRIDQHLESGSTLAKRLAEAEISIKKCALLILPAGDLDSGSDNEEANEDLYEEIFSRIFTPHFTLRYG
jgi:hypothetical protein